MNITISYGKNPQSASISWARCLGALDVCDVRSLSEPGEAVRAAIEAPIGLDATLSDLVHGGETVAVLVSDAFRHTGVDRLLPVLIDVLNGAGVPDQNIILAFATGAHRSPTIEEQCRILGEDAYQRFKKRIYVHDAHDEDNLVYLGTTSRRTPVRINRRVHECDRIIATGAVVLHYFGGFGGGRKSIVPGIAGADTIAHNHALNLAPDGTGLNPAVRIGALDGNPVAEDMLEAARFHRVDFIVNTVMARDGGIAAVFAGELDAAHRTAAQYAHTLFATYIKERADLVIAASPTTRNFVQTHKAVFNAYQAVKPSGRIVLVAPCEEGLGGEQFAKWLRLGDRAAIMAGLRDHAEINGQTALSTREKAPITIMVTGLEESETALLGARKAASLEEALDIARCDLEQTGCRQPTFYLMPSAAYCVPFFPS